MRGRGPACYPWGVADSELVAYLRKHLPGYGEKALRAQLTKDGVPAADVEAALAELARSAGRPGGRKAALWAVLGGGVLLLLAGLMSVEKPAPSAGGASPAGGDPLVYRGHYGYILKTPRGYEAQAGFRDPHKTEEIVYLFPKGTDPQHFIHEGLYGHLGILRLEVSPRRVPQGFIGVDALKAGVTFQLDRQKHQYRARDLIVHGMPAFVINVEKPFRSVKAYLVGQKVRYTLTAGEDNAVFNEVLSSLLEASPHDRPGQ